MTTNHEIATPTKTGSKKRAAAKPRKAAVPAASGTEHSSPDDVAPVASASPGLRADTKIARVIGLLGAPGGASLAELCTATGWQTHSVRGALAGTLKRKGFAIVSEVIDRTRRYRLASAA